MLSQLAAIRRIELERRLEELPLLPLMAVEVLSANPEAEGYADRLLNLASRDEKVAAHVLRCANSALNPPPVPIVSLRRAVARLGMQQCADLVVALAIARVFPPRSEAQRFLWIHSLQTALFARMFCEQTLPDGGQSDQAFLCGFLHDIGRIVQSEVAPDDLKLINDLSGPLPQEQAELERSALGYDHALLGWHVCREWALPAAIGEVVRDHHDPSLAVSQDLPSLVRIVQWADMLSIALFAKPDLVFAPPEVLARHLQSVYPAVASGIPEVGGQSWHHAVLGVYARSMQLAHEVICFCSGDQQSPSDRP